MHLTVPPPAALVTDTGPKVGAVAPEVCGFPVGRPIHTVVRGVGLPQVLNTGPLVEQAGGRVLELPVLGLEVFNDLQRALHQLVRAL